MTAIKFTCVKLIIPFLSLIGVVILVFQPNHTEAQLFAIQSSLSVNQSAIPEKIIATTDSVTTKPEKQQGKIASNTNEKKESNKPQKRHNSLFIKALGDRNVIEIKKDLIVYGNNHFPVFFRKFYIRVIEKTYLYPIILLFIFLIFIFILNIILVLLGIYFSNRTKNRRDKYIRIYSNLYERILRSYLFGETDWDKTLVKLKRINKPLNRKILTLVLFNFQENLTGEMDTQIPEIFVKLGLYKDAENTAKSSFYYHQIIGMRELTNLYPQGAMALVKIHLNDPNDLVRAEAQIAYIRLHPAKPFDFFRSLTSPFTRWTQLSAFYLFRLHQIPVPSFVDYLDSEHPNVRNFCLRMIIYFQQLENATAVFNLLDSQLELTRFLSIRAINELRLFQGKDLIKNRYPTETGKNRMEIIKTLKNIGNSDDFNFLESIIQSGSISEKTEACRSLYFMNTEGRERLLAMKQQSDIEIDKYLEHITDLRN